RPRADDRLLQIRAVADARTGRIAVRITDERDVLLREKGRRSRVEDEREADAVVLARDGEAGTAGAITHPADENDSRNTGGDLVERRALSRCGGGLAERVAAEGEHHTRDAASVASRVVLGPRGEGMR